MFKHALKHVLRSGPKFRRYLEAAEHRQAWSPEKLRQYRLERLAAVIAEAYANIPFYRRMFEEHGLKPKDIQSEQDLRRLPLMDKGTVKEHFSEMINPRKKRFAIKGQTSGTTGSPGIFLRDMDSILAENALVWRHYRWGGKSFESRRVTLRGDLLVPADVTKPPFWKTDRLAKELLMSSYHLSEKNMPLYIERIREFDAFDFYAYPSTAFLVADYCRRKDIALKFEAVFTSSEALSNHQREVIEAAFSCPVFDWYGNAERNVAIGQCREGNYHEISDYAIHEYLPAEDGGYELIGTGLHNRVMPLMRYRTGDIVEKDERDTCVCDLSFPVIRRIRGRQSNFILTPEGRKVTIFNHIPRGIEYLIEMQLVQRRVDELQVLVVTTPSFGEAQQTQLLEKLRRYLSPEMEFEVKRVDSVPRSRQAKYQMVRQELSPHEVEQATVAAGAL